MKNYTANGLVPHKKSRSGIKNAYNFVQEQGSALSILGSGIVTLYYGHSQINQYAFAALVALGAMATAVGAIRTWKFISMER